MHRETAIQKLRDQDFDLCIIGAGASGAGCALDAVLRGLSVVIIDRGDFSSGTSSKSTRLVHGGVRYLEQAVKNLDFAQFRQVKHGLAERRRVLNNAPHLTRCLALATPVFSWVEGLYYFLGLRLYDLIASRENRLPKSRWLSKKEVLKAMPCLSTRLHSAVLYYDGQLDDARYCLSLVFSAVEKGAVALNYLELTEFEHEASGMISGGMVTDKLTGEQYKIRAKKFLNCAGPFSDQVRKMANSELLSKIKPSKGVHLVLPKSELNHPEYALLIPKTPDGRVVFAVPDQTSIIIGTTDQPYEQIDEEPVLQKQESEFLLETLGRYLNRPVSIEKIQAGFGGLRPLIANFNEHSTKKLVRDHEIEKDPLSGLLSLMGGKWTTYRLMASDTVDMVCKELQVNQPCRTEDFQLIGAKSYRPDGWQKLFSDFPISELSAKHLHEKYGDRAIQVLELSGTNGSDLMMPIIPGYPHLRAEVLYGIRFEMAMTLRDVIARRLRIESASWAAAVLCTPIVAEIMGQEYGWSVRDKEKEIKNYLELIAEFQRIAQSNQGQSKA